MKSISREDIASALAALIENGLCSVEKKTLALLRRARDAETGEAPLWALDSILDNARVADENRCFACQDCGLAVVFATLGRDVRLDSPLEDSINEGVRRGYRNARKSAAHPLTRLNTGDNTPAVVYTSVVDGDSLTLEWLAKGAGSENMSAVYMLTPSKGRDGIIDAVVDCVRRAGANPCPPLVLGVGVGGTMDKAAQLSKRALLRETGSPSPDPDCAALEAEILARVNALGIGAQGLGGNATALAVHLETFPTHIGMLPVAVTVQCHSVRHGAIVL